MSDLYGPRTPRRPSWEGVAERKRTRAIQFGVLGAGLLGGYALTGVHSPCKRPPEANSPEALAMDQVAYRSMVQEYEQCRRRRTSTSSRSRSRGMNLFSSKSSVSRGGFGRSGSFGG